MAEDQFTYNSTHISVIRKLLYESPNSFFIYFPDENRAAIVGSHWCFVEFANSLNSVISKDQFCEELVAHGVIAPELTDHEFEIQISLGTQVGRIYKLSAAFRKIFEGYFLSNKASQK